MSQTASYEDQLIWLAQVFRGAQLANDIPYQVMLLSLAQSVKNARNHNLNCRRDPHEKAPRD